MRKLFSFLALLLCVAVPAAAQTTLVTGQVKDINGVPYAGAQISAQLVFAGTPVSNPTVTINVLATCRANGFGSAPCQVPFNPSNGPFSLDAGGNIPGGGITLQDNTQVTPSGTQWAFKVNTAGNSPPLGTGPQTCTATLAVSTGSQSISASFSTCPALSNVTGGGASFVSVLPATCTPGTTPNVFLSTGPNTKKQEYQCGPAVNTWFPFNSSLALSPISFGAAWDALAVTDATFTNTSNTVTCPNSDCNFTTNDLGKIVFGTTFPPQMTIGCAGVNCGSVILPQGFICAINNANSISVGTTFPGCAADNATAGCVVVGGTPNCALLWGTQDDSAAINSTSAAAWTPNSCRAVFFPSGMAFFTVPAGGLLNVNVTQGSPCSGQVISDATQSGPVAYGSGPGTSVLVPLPSTNFANCTAGGGGTACIYGAPNWFGHDFSVWGFGQADAGTTHNVNLIQFDGNRPGCVSTAASNLSLNNWEAASAGSQGFVILGGCGVIYSSNVVSEGFGNTDCVLSIQAGGNLTVNALDCFGAGGANNGTGSSLLWLGAGGGPGASNPSIINTTGSFFWGGLAAANVAAVKIAASGGIWNSLSDIIRGPTEGNNNFGIFFANAGTQQVNLNGSTVTITNNAGAGNSWDFFCGSGAAGCQVSGYGANIVGVGAHTATFTKTGTPNFSFTDACANNYTFGGGVNSALNIFGLCSQTATTSATTNFGTALAAQTVVNQMSPTGPLTLNLTIEQITAGVGCGAGSNTVTPTLSYTAPGGTVQTPALTALTIAANGAVDTFQNDTVTITTKPNTSITYTAASTLASVGCTTTPQYQVFAKAVQ